MADGRHLKKQSNRDISATVCPFLMIFSTMMHTGPVQQADR